MADIDRGGLSPTWWERLPLLTETERARIAAFVINRFRGDLGFSNRGSIRSRTTRTNPCSAYCPFSRLASGSGGCAQRDAVKPEGLLRVIAPALPRITNHTDFDPLRLHPQVAFRYLGPGDLPRVRSDYSARFQCVRVDLAAAVRGWEYAIRAICVMAANSSACAAAFKCWAIDS